MCKRQIDPVERPMRFKDPVTNKVGKITDPVTNKVGKITECNGRSACGDPSLLRAVCLKESCGTLFSNFKV